MDLVLSEVPGRKGIWLGVQKGNTFYHVAKFRDDEALEHFKEWARQSDGKVFFYEEEH